MVGVPTNSTKRHLLAQLAQLAQLALFAQPARVAPHGFVTSAATCLSAIDEIERAPS